MFHVVDDLEQVLLKQNILQHDSTINPVEEARLNSKGYWLAHRVASTSIMDTKRIAFDDDFTPAGNKWVVRHDFIFLHCNMATNVYFIPQVELTPQEAPVALIGYASSIDIEALSRKYEMDPYVQPSTRRKVFTQFERKFLSPGIAKNRNAMLLEHTANAEASTSGGVVIDLSNQSNLDHEAFLFAGLRMFPSPCSPSLPSPPLLSPSSP